MNRELALLGGGGLGADRGGRRLDAFEWESD